MEGWVVGRYKVAAGLLGEVTVETGWKLKAREGDVDDGRTPRSIDGWRVST